MERNPLNQEVLGIHFTRIGPVTREMVHQRTLELARLAGYAAPYVRQTDYEQAKRELTGESDISRQDAVLDSRPETKRRDAVPGLAGRQTHESPGENEDGEGRNETGKLFGERAAEVERGRMFQAAQVSAPANAPAT